MTYHTKGPWQVNKHGQYPGDYRITARITCNNGKTHTYNFAEVYGFDGTDCERNASGDAYLIGAAPDLYEALQALVRDYSENNVKRAEAALELAKHPDLRRNW